MGSPQCSMTEFPTYSPTWGHPGSVISATKKYKVAGLGLLRGNGSADVVKPLRRLASHIPAGMIDNPANEAGTIKAGAWGAAAPHIGIAHILFRLGDHGGKGFVL